MDAHYTYGRMDYAMQYLAENGCQYRGNLHCVAGGKNRERLQFVNYDTQRCMLLDVDEEDILLRSTGRVSSAFLNDKPFGDLQTECTEAERAAGELLFKYGLIKEVKVLRDIEGCLSELCGSSPEGDKVVCLERIKTLLQLAGYKMDERQDELLRKIDNCVEQNSIMK